MMGYQGLDTIYFYTPPCVLTQQRLLVMSMMITVVVVEVKSSTWDQETWVRGLCEMNVFQRSRQTGANSEE